MNTVTKQTVTLIPAKPKIAESPAVVSDAIIRVAAYCRVSTEEENQQNSYSTQVAYYTELITAQPHWELIGIFADEGISGTQTSKRTEFNRMIRLCRRHKIDLVLCKSISRFARNTVDCLNYVRELKSLGINVKFEKENIETLSSTSEFIISLYASFAQAESESISKNITWGIEKSFQAGKIRYQLSQTLGYKMVDGKPVIIEEEAKTVRLIFRMFANGQSAGQIANYLTEKKIPRKNGNPVWSRANVQKLLQNEKYVGDAVLQKTYTVDCLSHKRAKNTGQKAQYYIRNCHDAIIGRNIWDKVQQEFVRRSTESKSKRTGKNHVNKYYLSGILTCPYCGSNYKRTIWKSAGRKIPVWRCGTRLEHGKKMCAQGASIHEDKLHATILNAVNNRINKSETALLENDLFENIHPLNTFDEPIIPKLVKRIDVINKEEIKIIFCDRVVISEKIESMQK